MSTLRSESLAIQACQQGNVLPLLEIFKEPEHSPRFAMMICMRLARGKPGKITKRERVGVHVDALRRKQPGLRKSDIVNAVAKQFGIGTRTAENYYAHWLKITKPVRHTLNLILEADQ